MKWIALSEALPSGTTLVYAGGEFHVAVLMGEEGDLAFMDIHSCDLLPWPSHWLELTPPPTAG